MLEPHRHAHRAAEARFVGTGAVGAVFLVREVEFRVADAAVLGGGKTIGYKTVNEGCPAASSRKLPDFVRTFPVPPIASLP